MDAPLVTAWWPLTRKIRAVVAIALLADAASVASWLLDQLAGSAAVAAIVVSTAGAIAGYLTRDSSSPPA